MPTSGPEGSIDKVLQPDGTYKWQIVPHPRSEELDSPSKKVASKPKASPKTAPKQPKAVAPSKPNFDNAFTE